MTRKPSPSGQSFFRVLVLCNGERPSRSLARRLAQHSSLIVAADGGSNGARRLGIRPDVIIGDLDSITPATRTFFSGTRILHLPRQDNTDLEKALEYIRAETPAKEVIIIGATGRRIDLTLGNLAVLSNDRQGVRIVVCGDGWHAFPVRGSEPIYASRGTTVSLIPFGDCHGVTLKGLKFPLRDATLRAGQVAVSNVVRSSPFTISLRRGKLLAVVLEGFHPR